MNEKDGAIRDANVLGVPKMLILGLQHMFAMFGATILVPILVNSYFGEDVLHVQVTLICAGIGTPSMFQIQGSGVSRFFLCLPRRFCHDCKHGFRCIRRHVQR